jgi:cyclopropane fatty-acyl-phospholipid synthase-like methyltransferase
MIKRPERLLWAREVLNIKPNDNILEIGCGAGLMSKLIADRLKTGRLLAIDKSRSNAGKSREAQ